MLVYGDYSRSAEPKQVAGAAAFSLQLTCDQSVVKSDKLRLVVVFDYQLSRTPLRGRSDAYPCAKRLLQLLKCRARVWVHLRRLRFVCNTYRSVTPRCKPFQLPDGDPAPCGALGKRDTKRRIPDHEQSTAMPSGKAASLNQIENRLLEPEQSGRINDCRPIFSGPCGDIV